MRGWVAANEAVTLALRSADEATDRWVSARAFCLVLLGGRERLVTDAQSWSQSVCRAFATELLAPAAYLRQRIDGDVVTDDDVRIIADELRAPRRAVEHQIQNHDIAVVVDYNSRRVGSAVQKRASRHVSVKPDCISLGTRAHVIVCIAPVNVASVTVV